MNKRRYRIYYDSAGLPKGEMPLSAEKVTHHLECLPIDLDVILSDDKTRLLTVPVAPELGEGLNVTLISNKSNDQIDDLVADTVRKINARTSGLCFLIDRVSTS